MFVKVFFETPAFCCPSLSGEHLAKITFAFKNLLPDTKLAPKGPLQRNNKGASFSSFHGMLDTFERMFSHAVRSK